MKQATLLLVLCCAACGCASKTFVSYQTTVQIEPAKEAGRYSVVARIAREVTEERVSLLGSGRSRRTTVLTAPKLICQPGTPASVNVDSEDGSDSILVEATITRPGEKKPTTCFVALKEEGRLVSVTSVRVPAFSP